MNKHSFEKLEEKLGNEKTMISNVRNNSYYVWRKAPPNDNVPRSDQGG